MRAARPESGSRAMRRDLSTPLYLLHRNALGEKSHARFDGHATALPGRASEFAFVFVRRSNQALESRLPIEPRSIFVSLLQILKVRNHLLPRPEGNSVWITYARCPRIWRISSGVSRFDSSTNVAAERRLSGCSLTKWSVTYSYEAKRLSGKGEFCKCR